ncbi:hypothetical protein Y032_0270g858 [Ancylostoma ceylanicum]|uniref:Uncharacterized protein n=1 Tax=Ancylostoma ceylanicum TaxID=53326 RepID=A0A016S9F5_9BILA|nr:hypothetical protein Y032_0270g858 [Ancylostoma ceylanicum]
MCVLGFLDPLNRMGQKTGPDKRTRKIHVEYNWATTKKTDTHNVIKKENKSRLFAVIVDGGALLLIPGSTQRRCAACDGITAIRANQGFLDSFSSTLMLATKKAN